MGNLPFERSVNVDDSDPVPSGLLGELQDQFVGDKRQVFTRRSVPLSWNSTGSAATRVLNPKPSALAAVDVWKLPAEAFYSTQLTDYDIGAQVRGFKFRAYGDGVIDITSMSLVWHPAGLEATNILDQVGVANFFLVNVPEGWVTYTATMVNQVTLTQGGALVLILELVAGGVCLHFDTADLIMARP